MKKTIAAFLAFLTILLGTAQSANACSVVAGYPGTPVQNIANKDIAFIGTVQSVSQEQGEYSQYRITFKNEVAYKGIVPAIITLRSQSSSAACGYDDGVGTFTVGSTWMMYANGNATEGYSTNAISLNTKYDSVSVATAALAAAGLTPGTILPSFTGTLRLGSRGEVVQRLQSTLAARGYASGAIDGIFGKMTRSAVLKYQAANNLGTDGIVGIKTAANLSL